MLVQTLFKPEEHNNDLLRNEYISQELNYNIATISFMSRGLDNLQATKLRVCTLVVFSAGGRKHDKYNHFNNFRADYLRGSRGLNWRA